MAKPIVAIVGRPNVGKSSLLNRLIRSREAIVEDTPGVTRDRIYRDCEWNGRTFSLVDTGGILVYDTDKMRTQIRIQVEMAIDEADLILFMTDVVEGLHPLDYDVAELLRTTGKKIVLVVNKADNPQRSFDATEFYSLGFGDPFPVSALNGLSTGDLLDLILENLPEPQEDHTEEEAIRISIVGKPNVGKSSLLNAIIGEERSIVTNVPGTTRDAVDSTFMWHNRKMVFIDTAGIRRHSKVEDPIEVFSVGRAKKAIKRCDVGLLVMDADDAGVMQEKRIGGMLQEAGRGTIIVINKWDKVDPDFNGAQQSEMMKAFENDLRYNLEFLYYAPIVFTSALNKQGIEKLLPLVVRVWQECIKKIDTPVVNKLFQEAFFMKPPPSFKGKSLKLYYAFQQGAQPPTFTLKVNSRQLVHFSYERYLENQVRKALGFEGTPIKLLFRKSG
ncbi:MAG: ribosome biogenesis GTPase Der [Firmicutes bacterium]|nr:ribosome biogenesis GTPase Der [Bacillota bacterium]